MKYYQLMYDWNNDNDATIFCNKQEIYVDNEYIVSDGIELENFDERTTFYYEKGSILEDYLDNIMAWPIVSAKLKNTIIDLEVKGVKFFSIKIKSEKTNEIVAVYWLLNIFNCPDALDLQNSKYREIKNNTILGLTHPVLEKEKIKDMEILRLKNDTISIYISEKLKKAIEDNNITGLDFRQVKII